MMRFLLVLTAISGFCTFPLQARTLEYGLEGISDSLRLSVNYIMQSLLPFEGEHFVLNERLSIDCAGITESLCSDLEQIGTARGQLDYGLLRQAWLANFLGTRGHRGNETIMTDSLEEFKQRSGFEGWTSTVIDSRVKRVRRRLSRGFIDQRRVSIAETLSDAGEVRETEVAIERIQQQGNFEFYTYNQYGSMVLESEFPAGMRPSPVVCVACHMNGSGAASRFIPIIN